MSSIQVVEALTGASTFIALLALLGYWIFFLQSQKYSKSIREVIQGEGLFDAKRVERILAQFKDEEHRLEALKELTKYDAEKAKRVLEKVKADINLENFDRADNNARRKQFIAVAVTLLLFALLGLAYTLWTQAPAKTNPVPENRVDSSREGGPIVANSGSSPEVTVPISPHTDRALGLGSIVKEPPTVAAPVIPRTDSASDVRPTNPDSPLIQVKQEAFLSRQNVLADSSFVVAPTFQALTSWIWRVDIDAKFLSPTMNTVRYLSAIRDVKYRVVGYRDNDQGADGIVYSEELTYRMAPSEPLDKMHWKLLV
ncbi:hypothetical protein BX589_10242 [Paraburkholderia fungorum]|uniref:hypothetical protein n=1 Tax=Paraburkholderia fungorum TaxID=134537 RepID=UPI000D04F3BA|nr:hypothetical protein [Paraburkholderia fungorum]PRZ55847.1 hypothetical protein BX589_10242 [Paraburkholderia fungorum]